MSVLSPALVVSTSGADNDARTPAAAAESAPPVPLSVEILARLLVFDDEDDDDELLLLLLLLILLLNDGVVDGGNFIFVSVSPVVVVMKPSSALPEEFKERNLPLSSKLVKLRIPFSSRAFLS